LRVNGVVKAWESSVGIAEPWTSFTKGAAVGVSEVTLFERVRRSRIEPRTDLRCLAQRSVRLPLSGALVPDAMAMLRPVDPRRRPGPVASPLPSLKDDDRIRSVTGAVLDTARVGRAPSRSSR
jgi:hypothetical protein